MTQSGMARKDPSLLREDEDICARVRTQLNNCAEYCRDEASRAHDQDFRHALQTVADACCAGIKALECNAHAEYHEPKAATGHVTMTPNDRDWRPGGDAIIDD